jgi:hypothetical protein
MYQRNELAWDLSLAAETILGELVSNAATVINKL